MKRPGRLIACIGFGLLTMPVSLAGFARVPAVVDRVPEPTAFSILSGAADEACQSVPNPSTQYDRCWREALAAAY